MTNPNDAAFPIPDCGHDDHRCCPGLTKREEFAKAMMQGILSNEGFAFAIGNSLPVGDKKNPEKAAEIASRMAVLNTDALIAELNKDSK